MRLFSSFIVGALTLVAAAEVAAQDRNAGPVTSAAVQATSVIELFTSQGCNSCPPADALMESYAKRPDVLALSYSVDYWDYLGWKDTLASPKFSQRQKAYAKARGDGQVYTPQMVVNGVSHVAGSRKAEIDQAIQKFSGKDAAMRVPLSARIEKGHLVVEAGAHIDGAAAKDATLWLAVITPKVEVPVKRGENQGKTITYHNVVRELTPIGMWTGEAMTIKLERHAVMQPGTESCAVFLQQGPAGPILAGAMIRQW
jgi:hypothetical protein